MSLILTVAAKEFRTFFQTPMGAVILFVSTLLAGWWFFSLQSFFDAREASLRGLFSFLPGAAALVSQVLRDQERELEALARVEPWIAVSGLIAQLIASFSHRACSMSWSRIQ